MLDRQNCSGKTLIWTLFPPCPQYNVDYCDNNILKQHNDFYCKRYLPKSNIVRVVGRGGGGGGLFKTEIYIEKSIVGTFL